MIDALEVIAALESAQLLVFDLDGTLYDDRTYLLAADTALEDFLADNFGVARDVSHGIIHESTRAGRSEFLDRVCRRLDVPVDAIPRMLEVIRGVEAPIQLHSWVAPLMERLHRCGIPIWILTNGNVTQQKNKLKLLGVSDGSVPVEVSFAEDHRPKPSAEGLLHILSTTNVRAEHAVMIGDSKVDQACAEACGVRFIPVSEVVKSWESRDAGL